jgi:L-malate glycosyltransferase
MKHSAPIPVLFTHYGEPWIRGSEQLLLDLLAHLDPARVRPIVWCNQRPMADAARALGLTTYRSDFEVYFDYLCPRFRLSRYRALMREARDLIRRHQIRVLHSNSAGPCQWLAPVARRLRLPLLAHLHTGYLRRSRYALLLHQASLVVGVSRQVVTPFIEDGIDPEYTRIIYNGIDFSRLRPKASADFRRALGLPNDAVVVTSIGSLIRRKGQDVLLRAFSLLGAARERHLLVVGDGPEQAQLERLVVELGLKGRVTFLGYSNDIGQICSASDVLALASRMESFGLVLAEAGYFGLPVVASAVGGIPEVVEDGVTGLLVPPEDPAALAAALARLIDDRDYRIRLGRAGRERVEVLFSVERMAENFHQAYERLNRMPRRRLGWLAAATTLKPYLRLFHRRRGNPARLSDHPEHSQRRLS